MSKFKWQLERASNKFTCPSCGREKRFKRYVYEHNGEYIDDSVGICDRKNSCKYHYPPKQFFKDRGLDASSMIPKEYMINSYQMETKQEAKIYSIDNKWIDVALSCDTSFMSFLKTKFTEEQINEIQILYFLGAVDYGDGEEGDVIFWQVDSLKRVRAGKIMKYNPTTGKRLHSKDAINWLHKISEVKEGLPEGWHLTQCLFGEHLITSYPLKPICLVESEKTAIIASVYLPEYNWLATGGLQNFNIKMCNALNGKTVEVFPDIGAFEEWSNKAKEISKELDIEFIFNTYLEENSTPEQKELGIDIGDVILDGKASDLIEFMSKKK